MMQKKKFTNMWILENILLKTQWVKEETTMEIRNYFEMNENENTMYQTLQAAKAVLRGKFIAVNTYIKK